jgi:hypothetical protein
MLQAVCAEIVAGMASSGMVQTSDTGQLNPASVTVTVATSQVYAGYLVFRFSDALQATAPVFIKVNVYVAGSNPPGSVGVDYTIEVGTATNGAGSLQTNYCAFATWTHYSTPASSGQYDAAVRPWYWAGDGSFLTWVAMAESSGTSYTGKGFFCIERTRDVTTGLPDGAGILITESGVNGSSSVTTFRNCNLIYARPVAGKTVTTGGRALILPWVTSHVVGSDVYLAPCIGDLPEAKAQMVGQIGLYAADMTFLAQFAATIGGTSRNYLHLGAMAVQSPIGAQTGMNGSLAVRYD